MVGVLLFRDKKDLLSDEYDNFLKLLIDKIMIVYC